MAEPVLELKNISGGYDQRTVIRDISMTIREGDLIGIIGPNGHGKSTLLRAISALLPWRSGEFLVGGRDVSKLTPDRMVNTGIVHVPQGDLLFPHMSVEENLVMGAYLRPKGVIADGLDEVYALFPHLADRRRQIVNSLSGGERRMVGIGRGLMSAGHLMMLDEPSLGLAPKIIDHIYAVLKQLKDTTRSVLLVEENPGRIVDLADQIFLVDDGAIIWSGRGDELAENSALLSTYFGKEFT